MAQGLLGPAHFMLLSSARSIGALPTRFRSASDPIRGGVGLSRGGVGPIQSCSIQNEVGHKSEWFQHEFGRLPVMSTKFAVVSTEAGAGSTKLARSSLGS